MPGHREERRSPLPPIVGQPLHQAAARGRWDLVERLLDAGADPLVGDAHDRPLVERVALGGRTTLLRRLVGQGCPLNPGRDDDQDNPTLLHTVLLGASGLQTDVLLRTVRVLLDLGVDPNAGAIVLAGERHTTALMLAVRRRDPDEACALIDTLVGAGATVDQPALAWVANAVGRDRRVLYREARWTALMVAAQEGLADAADALMKHGADLSQRLENAFGPRCVTGLVRGGHDAPVPRDRPGLSAIELAREQGHTALAVALERWALAQATPAATAPGLGGVDEGEDAACSAPRSSRSSPGARQGWPAGANA